MRKSEQSSAGERQQGHRNSQMLFGKSLQLLDKFRQHESSQIGDDSGNDCRIGVLIVPN
jgi:hypothetical protein